MATQVTMPMLGLTMEEGTVAEWLKAEGDAVDKDEPLLVVEMDKGTQEVPSPASGVLRRIVVQAGTTVPIRTLIAEIGEPGEVSSPTSAGGPGDMPPVEATPGEVAEVAAATASAGSHATARATSGPGDLPQVEASPSELSAATAMRRRARLFASPRARMRARSLGVDVASVRGTGPHGRVVEADVLAFTPTDTRMTATPVARRLAQEHGVDLRALAGTGPGGRITQDDVLRAAEAARAATAPTPRPAATGQAAPLSRLRRIVAERMASSAQTTARVTLFLDADFTEAARFRQQLQPEFARLGAPKLPWDALIAKAAASALQEHAAVQRQWIDGQGLRHPEGVHVGIAVAVEPEGLLVPVLKNAHARSLRELSAELLMLVDKARAGRLSPGEMQAGTFTITNLGAYGIDGFTPIINPPETAILGVGRIADKAVARDGAIVARRMCTLSLSFDHRVVDGAPAAAFLARLAELLERPYALLGV